MNESHRPAHRSKQSKKPYAAPRLTEYGPVEKLTHSGSGTFSDSLAMMMDMTCL